MKTNIASDPLQYNLFDQDICRNRHGGNPFSDAAHESAKATKQQTIRDIIDHLKRQGINGATCDEIEVALGLKHQTASARCSDLKNAKIVKENGRRKTRSGSTAAVLVLVKG